MAKSKQSKEIEFNYLVEQMPKAQSMVFVDYSGMTVEESTSLRRKAKEVGAEFIVTKKTLIKKALDKSGVTNAQTDGLKGNIGLFLGYTDPVSPAKIAKEFSKTSEHLKLLAGVMDFSYMNKEQVNALASLPSREQLLGMLVGQLNAPISSFVNVLAGNLRGFVNVLKKVGESKA